MNAYRAWNKGAGKMLHFENGFLQLDNERSGLLFPVVEGIMYLSSGYQLMLWSGETDVAGVRIYTGDLLKVTVDGSEKDSYVSEVTFERGAFVVDSPLQDGKTPLGWLENVQLTVVGNIYQTPYRRSG